MSIIYFNRKAKHKFLIFDKLEAGISFFGWEIKSIRCKKFNLDNTYVIIKANEALLLGANFIPINTTNKLITIKKTKKLLLKKKEIFYIKSYITIKRYSCIPLKFYWKNHLIKCQLALVKGNNFLDKRDLEKQRDIKQNPYKHHIFFPII
ncbi:SsrA-binding protein SmpB [Candidatus Portiera aleyrodidarum]|uniref:SsrA-binding protein n=1 Tax=Candidatus Portiera aleyrodidarum MED (Bemisia tabaci) TaxID=1163752 RepID=A0AAU8S352_9GAMM|nr:SsrA-binding protein SmpB [Candidatus Portiera aleyrodidarum]AFQ24229.1 tmRNA-binding protein [Candidatus Portiera aleyrodidarum BT-B-HRs]AFS18984.1 SsrA-binding protein [Candidatus Portiera aleyrodidarum BT-QVLC]AFT80645.1 tmRNA-binding protein SmpB [Candidatus Portiera aleyrodidarum BT-QVLC]AFT80918.1 tmRNA-binding protein SmpB [Candidatus Portiera aleyrodidarum BT-B-HRs]AJF24207.1 tmRNA-binding protein [Candidatus Portiera aleyrodidarum MED (Bemisia tabaci)]